MHRSPAVHSFLMMLLNSPLDAGMMEMRSFCLNYKHIRKQPFRGK